MKIVVSFCFVTFLSLFLFNCSQKESSSVAPEDTNSLSKKGGRTTYYEVSGDVIGSRPRENITLVYDEIKFPNAYFRGEKTGIAYNARTHNPNQPIFVHFFDYDPELERYNGKFRCEGHFGRKEPLVYTGPWVLTYFTGENTYETIVGEGVNIIVIEEVR